ncbi:Carbohydrate kinase, FGGY family [Thioalkalivibrio nitratireducens DSM 14787]|uniref:Carbohydrate kinase, FGGY family n=1 Tax=Thioalkalivibrio nitratireducens (strain DSM 14787 / UNIQEM 213 / ALEN2) TaxID=1255043 RepID=L0DVP4_THIND|nr:Carbohydrate kinase, FGGY family [Thioalkalivibrio nitratireducens DSM 14787]
MPRHFVGLDLGTSGIRAVVLDAAGRPVSSMRRNWTADERSGRDPGAWSSAVRVLLGQLAARLPGEPVAIAVDGTSGTLLAVDRDGQPLGPALLYHDTRARAQAARLTTLAPRESAAHGAASSAAKLLWLREQGLLRSAARVLHQAEWICGGLLGRYDLGDANNALKLGYDPAEDRWPDWWLAELGPVADLLPRIVPAGTVVGRIDPALARSTGLHPSSRIVAGTTDSIAGFLATGVDDLHTGVTSLGSTLVLKQWSAQPVFDRDTGVYSHRVLGRWLAGGASNTGGAALAVHFTAGQITELSRRIDPQRDSGLAYYPLPATGERFPIHDPGRPPELSPRPADDAHFLHGLLEGIARIEAAGYAHLARLGTEPPSGIVTVGGGAANPQWTALRMRVSGVPVRRAAHEEAAHGAAMLARRAFIDA